MSLNLFQRLKKRIDGDTRENVVELDFEDAVDVSSADLIEESTPKIDTKEVILADVDDTPAEAEPEASPAEPAEAPPAEPAEAPPAESAEASPAAAAAPTDDYDADAILAATRFADDIDGVLDEAGNPIEKPKTRLTPHLIFTPERISVLTKPYRDMKAKKEAKRQAELEELERIERNSTNPIDTGKGLTDEQVHARVALGKVNKVEKKGVRSTGQIVVSHTLTYFNFLNIFLGVQIFLTGEYKNMLFLGVIICNSAIGIVQELHVRKLIMKLSVISAAKAKVRRNGAAGDLPIEEIVTDDVIEIANGDQIVTDGVILSGEGLEVNESMLTGESKPVKKKEGDKLLSGSFIVAGNGVMQVEKVGKECYAQQIVEKSHHRRRASSEMQITINRIIKVVSIAIIPVGLLLYRSQHAAAVKMAALNHYSDRWIFGRSIVRTVAGIIGMIPEGLVLLTSVSFIIGVGRLALKRALVQEMESIESLARVNVLCTDKTGTITTGKLRVAKLISVGGVPAAEIRAAAANMNGAFTDSNVTQEALDAYFGKKKDWTVTDVVPFSSDRKYKSASFEGKGTFYMGAPEYLVPERKDVLRFVDGFSRQGYRVLVLAKQKDEIKVPQAVIVISDIIKEDAKEVFDYFANAGVQVKVLSGDNPVTVSAVAVKAGVKGASRFIDASSLPEDPAELQEAIRGINIFGRVKPEQKQAFIKAWQAEGNTVAMVGDGVNDVLAIKDADCGIAMANGSEAAKQAAHIVLLDSDFTAMKDIVAEGKTIICNIERVSSLYLTKTIYACLLSIIFAVLMKSYPWTTLQMGLINVCGIGLPSFLLTLEQHGEWKAQGFLPHVLRTCVPAALTMVLAILVTLVAGTRFHWDDRLLSMFYLMVGGFVTMLVVGQVCWRLTFYRKIVFGASAGIFFLGLLVLPGFYDIKALWATPWTLFMIPMAFLVVVLIAGLSKVVRDLLEKFETARAGKRQR